MGFMLGNLSVSDIEQRLCIKFNDDDKKFLIENRQHEVNKSPLLAGKWHCFNIPFLLLCDSHKTVEKIYRILQKYEIKGSIQIGSEK